MGNQYGETALITSEEGEEGLSGGPSFCLFFVLELQTMKLGKFAEHVFPPSLFRWFSHAYMRVKLFGTTYYCPFCIGGFSKFYPAGFDFPVLKEKDIIGAGLRDNVRCPGCSSSNRERLVYFFLKNEGEISTKTLSVLHVAPEPRLQHYLKCLPNISHESVDIDSKYADKKMDLRSLQYPDAQFDVVICNHVLEHIPEDLLAMGEVFRVLKPGGFAVLQVPISTKLERTFEDFSVVDPKDRERVFGQSDHIRIYSGPDYEARLRKVGFTVEVLDYTGKLGEATMRRYALDSRERIYMAKRPTT